MLRIALLVGDEQQEVRPVHARRSYVAHVTLVSDTERYPLRGMRRTLVSAAVALTLLTPTAATAAPASAPDCRFENARSYEDFGRIRTFTAGGNLYGCLTDVGRAYQLNTGKMRARSAATRRALFGFGDWVAHPVRTASGKRRVRATNLRTGERHAARAAASVTAVVVNVDGTLAWIAGTELSTKAAGRPSKQLASEAGIDRYFLGLEKDVGCAVTWLADGEQRSSAIYCSQP
jgi:hypothetical protein